jgi:transcriptional regulator with XRE-family HTH domain
MANDTFNKRFKQLVQGLSDTELGYVLGVSADAARKMRQGDIKSLKLQAALRLARKLDISPWYIACEPEPTTPLPPLPQTRGTHKASSVPKLADSLRHTPVESTMNIPDVLPNVAKFQKEMRAEMRQMRSELQATYTAIREIRTLLAKQGEPSAASDKSEIGIA